LTRATLLARKYAWQGVLILPADLPLLTKDDLRSFLECLHAPPCVVISPDRHDNGTNAFLTAPGGLVAYDFGPGSFKRHCTAAVNAGAKLEVVRNERIMLDLDTPDDLKLFKQLNGTKA
jgi:2-phospho-L-lactate guanylyltransferase